MASLKGSRSESATPEAVADNSGDAGGSPSGDPGVSADRFGALRDVAQRSSDLMVVLDREGRVLYANPAALATFGISPEDGMGSSSFAYLHPEDLVRVTHQFVTLVREPGATLRDVVRTLTPSGQVRELELVSTNCLDNDGVAGIVINGRDVTERVNLSRALQTLTQGNQVLVHATEESALLNDLCSTIVSSGTYRLAWVGAIEQDEGHTIRPVAAAGCTEHLDEVRFSWGDNEFGAGPTGHAVRSGTVQVLDDIRASEDCEPWRGSAERYGLRTGCAFPLIVDEQLIGTLSIYAGEPGAFGPTEVTLLGELADDLAYGVTRLRDGRRLAENEALLRETEQRFRLAFEDNMAPMSFTDLEDRLIAVNDAFCEMVGFEREELLGRDSKPFTYFEDVGITEESLARAMLGQDDHLRYVKRYQRKDGRVIVVEVSRSPARDDEGRTIYFVFSERDITEERALTAQLSHQALHDPLTGLANRALFDDRLLQAHARVARHGGSGAVLLLDLDDFKGVNDTHGHLVGDQMLVAIAHRLERAMGPSDTLSRFGGDEFLYLAEGLSSPSEAEEVAARLLEVLATPFSFAGVAIDQHASIGVLVWDDQSRSSREFIQNADVALHEAKRQGKGHYVVFTPSMHQQAVSHFELVQELRRALSNGELSMHYQPIVDLTTGDVMGFESLMRWRHPEQGWVTPTVFIPLAERSELILELGAFALHEAVTEASTWQIEEGHTAAPYVTVNLSAHQFQDPGLVATIVRALTASELAPQRLILEITESVALLDVTRTMSVMEQLNELGIGFALDDFGTGFSSLSHLVLLRPKVIKIDQSFIRPLHESSHNDTLLEMIISLGQRLDMTVLAEGIETQEQLARLSGFHCELGQGYLFSPAVPAYSVSAMYVRAEENWGIEGWQRQPRLRLSD
ncbi:MAG: EAL domain-containing protein [Acidimicrobiales bacterium]|jgi:diguanylate cyclase (GGDEF)-like protein/PAS domain S-box-containing protein